MAILLIHVEMVREERDEKKRRRKKISKKEDKFNFYCLVGLGYEIYLFFLFVFFFLISSPLFSLYFFKPKITRNSSSRTILLLFIFYHRNILTNFG